MRPTRLLGILTCALFATAAFTPVPNRLNEWMAGSPRLERADAIVVLGRGGADTDGVLTNRSLRRMLHGIDLYRSALAPILVFSGGPEESRARIDLAEALGVPPAAILRVSPGLTTRAEADQLRRLLLPRDCQRVLLVADPVDMPRARASMERVGFTVLSAPTAASGPSTPEGRLSLWREITIELAGWTYYRLIGAV
jgi:uncharacterized SAM-binding protein YcdF (DUF218 family)